MYGVWRLLLKLTVLIAVYVVILAVLYVPYLWILVVLLLVLAARKRPRFTAFGTARWAEYADLTHLLEGQGVIVGYLGGKVGRLEGIKALFGRMSARHAVRMCFTGFRRQNDQKSLVRLSDALHVAVFAPSGAGKNVSIVGPFLRTSPENAVVIDFKGENARLSARHRARAFGHKIVWLDPFKLETDAPTTWNVIGEIDPADPECFDQARAVAEAIVPKEPNARDPHWNAKATIFIAGAILGVIHLLPPDRRSLQEVVEVLSSRKLLERLITQMQASQAHGGLLARVANEMALSSDKELDGILSTANRSLAFLSSPAVVESTRTTKGFTAADLERGLTVYLILPTKYMRSHAGLMRLWCTSIMQMAVARGEGVGRPLNIVLDECGQLGPVEAIKDMLTIGRGYRLKLLMIFQSMVQLRAVFPDGQDGVALSNTTQVFFAINDKETAEYVSARLGDYTEVVSSGGRNWGRSGQYPHGVTTSYSSGESENWSQTGRKLLQASELTQLDPRQAITLHPGVPPIITYLVRHYEKNYHLAARPGWMRVALDTLCLFLAVSCLAVWLTALVVRNAN